LAALEVPETFIQRQEESFLDEQRGAILRAAVSVTPLTLLSSLSDMAVAPEADGGLCD